MNYNHIDVGSLYRMELSLQGGIMKTKCIFVFIALLLNAIVSLGALDIYGTWALEVDTTIDENLHIHPGATVTNLNWNDYVVLTVNGSVTNEGSIITNSSGGSLYIYTNSTVTNYGVWNCNGIYLTSSGAQSISCPNGNAIETGIVNSNGSYIVAMSDLYFSGASLNWQNGTLDLSNGYDLFFDQSGIDHAHIIGGNGAAIEMTNSSRIAECHAQDLELRGTCRIEGDNSLFSGTTTITGSLTPGNNYYDSVRPSITGTFINNGTISNSGNEVILFNIPGDVEVINNGSWNGSGTYFTGTMDQHFIYSGTQPISTPSLYCSGNGHDLIFDTGINLSNTNIYLQGDDILLPSGTTLNLDSGSISNGSIYSSGAIVNLTNSTTVGNIDFYDVNIHGACLINGDDVTFNGTTTVTGALYGGFNTYDHCTTTIYGDIINNGTISNRGNELLSINLPNDITIVNNGTWTVHNVELQGTDQLFTVNGTSPLQQAYFNAAASVGNVYFYSDVELVNSTINFNNNTLVLQPDYTLTINDGYINEAFIEANDSVINMINNAYMQNTTVENAEFQGVCRINGDNNVFTGTTVLTGALRNTYRSWMFYSLTVDGDIINNGSIADYSTRSFLEVIIKGDISNDGTWSNSRTIMDGTSDQTVALHNSNYLTGDVKFNSDLSGTTYQWYKNGSVLDSPNFAGETTAQLDWNVPVSGDYIGTYNCDVTGRTLSRDIYVTEPGPPVMTLTLTTSSAIDFGLLYFGQDDTSEIIVQNDGNVDLMITDIYYENGSSGAFSHNYDNLGGDIAPGTTNSIFMNFEPSNEANHSGTLFIVNNSTNNPVIEINLSGSSEYDAIPAPTNVAVVVTDGDATISWDSITQTEHGIHVDIDFYVINYSDDPADAPSEYLHLAVTTNLNHVHTGVDWFADQMFYQVIAIRDYEGQYGTVRSQAAIAPTGTTWKSLVDRYLR